jgi:hypothetical protein
LSLYHSVGRVQSWVFGLERNVEMAVSSALLLTIITVVSFGVLLWRVKAPLRI